MLAEIANKPNIYNIAIIGNRPDKLFGYKVFGDSEREILTPYIYIYQEIRDKLKDIILKNSNKQINIISGMDLGIQQLGILAGANIKKDKTIDEGIRRRIKTIAIAACRDCIARWPSKAREIYHNLVFEKVDFFNNPENDYNEICYQQRDDRIINAADIIIAVYDDPDIGRTGHCIKYAGIKRKEMVTINPFSIVNRRTKKKEYNKKNLFSIKTVDGTDIEI